MARGRTHISVKKATYDKAKKLVDRYAAQGVVLTMEEALYLVKQDEASKNTLLPGWRI